MTSSESAGEAVSRIAHEVTDVRMEMWMTKCPLTCGLRCRRSSWSARPSLNAFCSLWPGQCPIACSSLLTWRAICIYYHTLLVLRGRGGTPQGVCCCWGAFESPAATRVCGRILSTLLALISHNAITLFFYFKPQFIVTVVAAAVASNFNSVSDIIVAQKIQLLDGVNKKWDFLFHRSISRICRLRTRLLYGGADTAMDVRDRGA